MAQIVLDDVTKVYGSDIVALDHCSLEIKDGEFMVLVGPSGCGKSTILRIIAGLEEVTAGEVMIGNKTVTDTRPKDRDVAMVFQNYALYPHMSVEENLRFGLKLRHMDKQEADKRVKETAHLLALDKQLQRKPAELSGGQRQRVAMGRAMVREPVAFLMDEPLSNLDAKLRVQMRSELARMHDRLGTTTVYVTHDQVEAMTLGDRVAVLSDGVLQQLGPPQELFNRPANLFVGAFIGSPPMNLVEATLQEGRIRFADFQVPIGEDHPKEIDGGDSFILGIRPSDIADADIHADGSLPVVEIDVEVTEELGSEVNVLFTIDAPPVTIELVEATFEEGKTEEAIPMLGSDTSVFCARVDARTKAAAGRRARLALDPARFHFFDLETGVALRAD